MLRWHDSVFVVLLRIECLHFLIFAVIIVGFDCVHIFHCTRCIVLTPPCFFLVAEDCDDSSGRWHLHAEVCLIDDCLELDDGVVTEDSIVWVGDAYHIKGYELCSLDVPFTESHVQFNFSEGLDFLPSEANEGVLGFMQVLFYQPHLDEALPSDDICGAATVDENLTHVVSSKLRRVPTNVGADDEGVIVRVMLKPEVGFGEGDWNMGPRCAEVFAFAYMRDRAEVFFPLPLRLVYRLV